MEGKGGGNVFGGEVEDAVKDIEAESGTGMSTPAAAGESGRSEELCCGAISVEVLEPQQVENVGRGCVTAKNLRRVELLVGVTPQAM